MGKIGKVPAVFITLGTVLAASAGAFLIERLITWDLGWALLWALFTVAVGGVLFWFGTRHQTVQARRMGFFKYVFAEDPAYELGKVTQEQSGFEAWARRLNRHADVLPPTTMPVTSTKEMELFEALIKSSLVQAESLTPGGPDFTLKVGGRLDACFYLGVALRNATGVTGRVWVASDCSIEYVDDFALVARFAPKDNHEPDRKGDRRREKAPEPRPEPVWTDAAAGLVAVPIMTFAESAPEPGLFCRNGGTWMECRHQGRHDTVVLAFDPQQLPDPHNRVSRTLDRDPDSFPNPVLAFVGMQGLGSTFQAYAKVLDLIVDSAEQARAAAVNNAELYVALLGPPAFAVALGARLASPDSRWHSLSFVKGKGYVPSPLRPQSPGRRDTSVSRLTQLFGTLRKRYGLH